ncbi:MAG: ABC transporter substrate-binding protein [candidate division WOR-3 bacterium]
MKNFKKHLCQSGLKSLSVPICVLLLTSAIICATIFVSCKPEPKTIKIGAILPLTGKAAWLGENARNGIQLAVDELNRKGGIKGTKIEVIFEDSKLDPKEGVAIANRLIDIEKVRALIVNGTTIVNAILPITEQKGILLFAQTIHPGITEKGKNIFRIYGGGDYEWQMLAQYINNQNYNIGIFHINAQYGLDSKAMLKKYLASKIKVVFEESYEIGATDFRALISKSKNKAVDAVVLMGYGNEFIALIKQMKELGFNKKILGNIDFTFDFLVKAPECQGAIFVAPAFSIGKLTATGQTFEKNYMLKFNKKPSWDVANSYETIMILAKVIEKVGTWNLEKIKESLLEIKDYEGISGKLTIAANRDAIFDLYIATLKDNNIVELR